MTAVNVKLYAYTGESAELICAICKHVFLEDDQATGVKNITGMRELGEFLIGHAHVHNVYDSKQPG